jgi:tRNA A37 threonylcarbamoyladenosine dehydratase
MSINSIVSAELLAYPRGDKAQNLFRAAYQMARAHGLGKHATVPPTREAALMLATRVVRRWFPRFIPSTDVRRDPVATGRLTAK